MKKLLTILFFVSTVLFAQDPILGTWGFDLTHKIDVNDLVKNANTLGGDFTEEETNVLYALTVIYVMGRCEYSEIVISDFENTVMVKTKNLYDTTIIITTWGKWKKIDNNLYNIILDSGEDETFVVNDNGIITLAGQEHQAKMISKLLANNLKLVKK